MMKSLIVVIGSIMGARGLRVELRQIYSWEKKFDCNDCDDIAIIKLTFPKFDAIYICQKCYDKFYQEQINRNNKYRS